MRDEKELRVNGLIGKKMPKSKGGYAKQPKAKNRADGKIVAKSKKGRAGQSKLSEQDLIRKVEIMKIEQLRPHPRNYRDHPEDQVGHVEQSIKENGFYRNVVIARDDVILAGHGVVKAAQKMGLKEIPVIRLNVESGDERALKILVGDNEISRLAISNDLALGQLLKELGEWDVSVLLGIGFNELDLKRLSSIGQIVDPRSEWREMPEFTQEDQGAYRTIIINFTNDKDVQKFAKLLGQVITDKTRSLQYPAVQQDKVANLRYVADEE